MIILRLVMYVRFGISCRDPIGSLIYATPRLGIYNLMCCWCANPVSMDSGLVEFEEYKASHLDQNVLPRCSESTCKPFGFVIRKSKKPNQLALKNQRIKKNKLSNVNSRHRLRYPQTWLRIQQNPQALQILMLYSSESPKLPKDYVMGIATMKITLTVNTTLLPHQI